ncbi:MAG: hypothetical protein GX159_02300 [Flavobacteriaceae bacterium]|jgi:hypothetical protein|nr:hypothetical protein [Flavobacteriaceae bacterium]
MEEKRQYKYADAEKALEDLRKKGYVKDYNAHSEEVTHNPAAFKIMYIYRYEGMSNPDDESTVYGIEHLNHGEKGVFVAGNLSFNEDDAAKVLLQLEIDGRKEELE